MKENEVGRACGTHGRGEKSVQGFGGKDHLKDQHLMEIGWGGYGVDLSGSE
jgi:hypothetical protein